MSKFRQLLEIEDNAAQDIQFYIRKFILSKHNIADNEVKSTKVFNVSILEGIFMVQIFYTNGKTEGFHHSFSDVEKWEKQLKED